MLAVDRLGGTVLGGGRGGGEGIALRGEDKPGGGADVADNVIQRLQQLRLTLLECSQRVDRVDLALQSRSSSNSISSTTSSSHVFSSSSVTSSSHINSSSHVNSSPSLDSSSHINSSSHFKSSPSINSSSSISPHTPSEDTNAVILDSHIVDPTEKNANLHKNDDSQIEGPSEKIVISCTSVNSQTVGSTEENVPVILCTNNDSNFASPTDNKYIYTGSYVDSDLVDLIEYTTGRPTSAIQTDNDILWNRKFTEEGKDTHTDSNLATSSYNCDEDDVNIENVGRVAYPTGVVRCDSDKHVYSKFNVDGDSDEGSEENAASMCPEPHLQELKITEYGLLKIERDEREEDESRIVKTDVGEEKAKVSEGSGSEKNEEGKKGNVERETVHESPSTQGLSAKVPKRKQVQLVKQQKVGLEFLEANLYNSNFPNIATSQGEKCQFCSNASTNTTIDRLSVSDKILKYQVESVADSKASTKYPRYCNIHSSSMPSQRYSHPKSKLESEAGYTTFTKKSISYGFNPINPKPEKEAMTDGFNTINPSVSDQELLLIREIRKEIRSRRCRYDPGLQHSGRCAEVAPRSPLDMRRCLASAVVAVLLLCLLLFLASCILMVAPVVTLSVRNIGGSPAF